MSSIRQVEAAVEYHLQLLFDERCEYDDIDLDLMLEYLGEIKLADEFRSYVG